VAKLLLVKPLMWKGGKPPEFFFWAEDRGFQVFGATKKKGPFCNPGGAIWPDSEAEGGGTGYSTRKAREEKWVGGGKQNLRTGGKKEEVLRVLVSEKLLKKRRGGEKGKKGRIVRLPSATAGKRSYSRKLR